jgi:lipid-A-disaccharide synthase
VVLSPCVNANGLEHEIAHSYAEVDRVQAAVDFLPFLLWGKTRENWDWRPQGVVIFLGGDQFYTLAIGRRLGYRTVSYIEWEARWVKWIDRLGIRQAQITKNLTASLASKCVLVGDLMADLPPPQAERMAAIQTQLSLAPTNQVIALLPGSRPGKLRLCLPLMLGVAECIQAQHHHLRWVIPVAPMLSLAELAGYADPVKNRALSLMGGTSAQLVTPTTGLPHLQTRNGVRVDLWTATPTYELLQMSQFAITTFGANTAELATLAVPMLVLIPTQELWQDYDGLAGLMTRLPGIGRAWGNFITWLRIFQGLGWHDGFEFWRQSETDWGIVQKSLGLMAWPNIWANREVVPELLGPLQPKDVSTKVLEFLEHPARLAQLKSDLLAIRGEPGAAAKLAQLVAELVQA